jgi:hypothetical protein
VHFKTLIWVCYRKNFTPLFINEEEELTNWLKSQHRDIGRDLKIGHTTDTGWGCTIRVAQMMLSNTFMRHCHKDQVICDWHQIIHSKEYINLLQRINDNTDGAKGVFSIRNITRMALVYDKLPGEWHGPGSISLVIRDLNRLY